MVLRKAFIFFPASEIAPTNDSFPTSTLMGTCEDSVLCPGASSLISAAAKMNMKGDPRLLPLVIHAPTFVAFPLQLAV